MSILMKVTMVRTSKTLPPYHYTSIHKHSTCDGSSFMILSYFTWMRIFPMVTKGVLNSVVNRQPTKKSPRPLLKNWEPELVHLLHDTQISDCELTPSRGLTRVMGRQMKISTRWWSTNIHSFTRKAFTVRKEWPWGDLDWPLTFWV